MSSPSPSPGVMSPVSSSFDGLEPVHTYAWTALAFILGTAIYSSTRSKGLYDAIPAIGNTGFFSSYLGAIDFVKNAKAMLQEGYDKHKSGVFRVPEMARWHLVVSGPALIEELRKAPDDVLSFSEAMKVLVAEEYTLGQDINTNPYHIGIVRNQLTRNLGSVFPDVRDEIVNAFEDLVPVTDGACLDLETRWVFMIGIALDTVMKIVARASNRVFVGEPKCRDPDYTALNIQFAIDVILGAQIINLFPRYLRPLAGALFTNVPKAIRRAVKHLGPIIEEHQRKIDEYGFDYPDKPNDFLTWLLDEAVGEERSTRNITIRILGLNFAAIHTSSTTFTHALFRLASQPEYIQPIREEVEAVVQEDGWSKVAMTRMRKLDSFLKETQRFHGLGASSMTRKAMKDFSFSDGTHIPKGAFVSVASDARHKDSDVYANGDTFDGFRFSDMRDEAGQGTKNQLVATSTEFLTFGHGRHACPGRFFAANELKAMMAHIVLTYDIKMEKEGVRPEDNWYAMASVPNRQAEVLFKKRGF